MKDTVCIEVYALSKLTFMLEFLCDVITSVDCQIRND